MREQAARERPTDRKDATRRPAGPATPAERLLTLQRLAGNAAISRAVDEERHEHDAGCGHGGPSVQRSAVHQVLRAPGRPLDTGLRTEMEARYGGADFSAVRVHTDSAAQRSAAEIGARAYTSGTHVVWDGRDKPTLAHELTHVIQQSRGSVPGTDNGSGMRVSDPSDWAEREAEANARRVMSGPVPVQRAPQGSQSAAPTPATGVIQRAYTGRHYVTYGPLHAGSGTVMKAELHPGQLGKGSGPSVKPPWWPTGNTPTAPWFTAQMVQGHLLNDNIGGPGNTMTNLTPLTRTGNSRHLHSAEYNVKDELKKGNIVEYEVRADYSSPVSGAALGAPANVAADIDANYANKIPVLLTCTTTVYDPQGKELYGESWIVHNEKV